MITIRRILENKDKWHGSTTVREILESPHAIDWPRAKYYNVTNMFFAKTTVLAAPCVEGTPAFDGVSFAEGFDGVLMAYTFTWKNFIVSSQPVADPIVNLVLLHELQELGLIEHEKKAGDTCD